MRGGVIKYTNNDNKTKLIDFDSYMNWNSKYRFGADVVLKQYSLKQQAQDVKILTENECDMILKNIKQNVTDLADEHQETTFYYFFPPYSICYWDMMNNERKIEWQINAEKLAIEEILKHPNIKLYSFSNNFELVCNLDNYKDPKHYGEWINSWMLKKMHDGEYLLTKDNYHEYINVIKGFYSSYDYESLHK